MRPLEFEYTVPSTLGHVVLEYRPIWLWESIAKLVAGVSERTNKRRDEHTHRKISSLFQ